MYHIGDISTFIYCSLFISHACIFCVRFWFQFLHLVVLKSSVFCWKLIGIVWTWRFQYIFLLVLPKRYTSEKPTILSIVLENVLKYRCPVVKNKDVKTFYFASRRGAKYCDLHVCMSVHLSVCLLAYLNKNSSGDEIANVNFYAVRPEATRIRWNNAK